MSASLSLETRSASAAGWIGRRLDVPVTLSIGLLSLLVACVPGAAAWLGCDWSAVATGQWWRLATGHLVHWNLEHLAWDLLVFVVLGAICEPWGRRRFFVALSAAALLIPLAAWLLVPELASYRGLSGLDTAIFALLAATVLRESWQRKEWASVALFCGLVAALAAKTGFELLTGVTWFVNSASAGFQPVPLAHVVGALCGAVIGMHSRRD